MNFSKHCNLCENEMTSLEKGLTCKLTNRKPEFKNTCPEIKLNNIFQEKLELINLELEKIRRNKNTIHRKFYIQIIFGFILMFICIWFLKNYTGVLLYFFVYPMITIGMTLWATAYRMLNRNRRKIKNIEFDKNEVDELLQLYGIEYTSNIVYQENIHGIQELEVELKYINWTKKRTTTPYKINC